MTLHVRASRPGARPSLLSWSLALTRRGLAEGTNDPEITHTELSNQPGAVQDLQEP